MRRIVVAVVVALVVGVTLAREAAPVAAADPGALRLSISDRVDPGTPKEGTTWNNGAAWFYVTLERPVGDACRSVHVTVRTVDGTATSADDDFIDVAHEVVFQGCVPGQWVYTQRVEVPILADDRPELHETFRVRLESAWEDYCVSVGCPNAADEIDRTLIVDEYGDGTILNDDHQVFVGDALVNEGDWGRRNLSFPVTVTGAVRLPGLDIPFRTLNGAPSLPAAEAGSDFVAPGTGGTIQSVSLPADNLAQRTFSFPVSVNGDRTPEAYYEAFTLESLFVGGAGSRRLGTGFILQDRCPAGNSYYYC